MNHGIKSSDDELTKYLKEFIILSFTERLRSFLQNQGFLSEFHYGLGILKLLPWQKTSQDDRNRKKVKYKS